MTLDELKQILTTYSWIKVKQYIDDESLSDKEKLEKFKEHHKEEIEFLIHKIRVYATTLYESEHKNDK